MIDVRKPEILVTAQRIPHPEGGNNVTVRDLYGEGVILAGGMPVAAFFDARHSALYAEAFDGLLLTGGGDVHPSRYGQRPGEAELDIDTERDALEFSLFDAFFRMKKPIFGICRGMQLINAALGGTLIQRLPGEGHWKNTHMINLRGDFLPFYGMEIEVNSVHRQAVEKLGTGLSVCAVAQDGVIEAIYHDAAPIFGVQWHPERMLRGKAGMARLFEKFLDMT